MLSRQFTPFYLMLPMLLPPILGLLTRASGFTPTWSSDGIERGLLRVD
jgi:hypothetical protein